MARIITVAIGQVVGGNWQPTTGLTTVNLRLSPFSSAAYTMDSALGDGIYKFNDVATDGDYKVYVGNVEQTYFGMICLGKDGAVLITGNQTIAGIKTFTQQIVASAGISTDTISEKTASAGVTIDGVLIKDSLNGSAIVTTNAVNQDVQGIKTFQSYPEIDSAIGSAPSGFQIPYAQWVSDLVASIIVTPYQQASKKRRIITGGTTQGNQVYTSFGGCTATITDNAIANRYRVFLEQGQNYTAVQDNIFYVLASQFKNYIDVIGDGKSTYVVLDGSTSLSVACVMANLNLYLGVNNISGARTLQSVTLKDVDIYAYNDLTLNNCILENVNIFQPTSKTLTLAGTSTWITGSYTNVLTNTASGIIANVTTETNTSYTMPTDLSLAP